MGYRSEVAMLITLPENVSARKIINRFKKIWGDYNFEEDFEVDTTSVEGCVYLAISDIKWYEGKQFGFKEVNGVMELVRNWEDYYRTGGVHYIRIGENYDDVEEIISGEVNEYLGLRRSIELP